uniref:putative calcium-binding protein CML23 n=1 Tax=Erigeron canadensis TaxID=72917 RepID=UPI001CB8C0BA|nr:putative calcium-binding protein CML23 [Erigeron canadensis]
MSIKVMNTKSSDYKRVFDHFDEDGNGMVSPKELQRRVGLICNEEVLVEDLEIVVQSLRNIGELGFEDFVSLVESDEQKEEEKLEDLRKAFRMYEMDGTDCITPKSLNRMLNRLGESISVDECVGMINRFDLNGDGVLNFDEFRAMLV